MRQVTKEMSAEKRRTRVLLMMPVYRNMMGMLSMAGPIMLLNMARTVEVEEFFEREDIL